MSRALRARGTTAGFAALGPVGKELVMKKILSLILVASLSVALAAPVYASRGHGGGFHGGSHGTFHHGFHHDGFHRGCCFAPVFVGGVFVGSAFGYPYYGYPYFPSVGSGLPRPRLWSPLSPARGLLRHRLLLSARRWPDGPVLVVVGSGRAVPTSVEPLRYARRR